MVHALMYSRQPRYYSAGIFIFPLYKAGPALLDAAPALC
jgi:hypothetical protein